MQNQISFNGDSEEDEEDRIDYENENHINETVFNRQNIISNNTNSQNYTDDIEMQEIKDNDDRKKTINLINEESKETKNDDVLIEEINSEIKDQNKENKKQSAINPNSDITYLLNKFESPKKRVRKEKEGLYM